jgi:hypothetical protein
MENLHQQFRKLGSEKINLTHRLCALLPQIYKSRIYKKYANSIEEYAWRYAGLSVGVVQKTLRLNERLSRNVSEECGEKLQEIVAEVGVHKVAIVASMINEENEEQMIKAAKNLSKAALITMRKEMLHGNANETVKLELDEEMSALFLKLKKHYKCGGNSEVMRRMLRELDGKHFPRKSDQCSEAPSPGTKPVTRYINATKRREVVADGTCAKCNKPYEHLHHQTPFSISKSHDSLQPLCKAHHELAHAGETVVDKLFRKHREEALL